MTDRTRTRPDRDDRKPAPPEEAEVLWTIALGPIIWSGHFLACYITGAIWCARVVPADGGIDTARWLVAGYTAAALAGIAWTGWRGWRRHSLGDGDVPHDLDTPGDRHRFLGFATVLLAGVSFIATVYTALPALFIASCRQ